MQLNAGQQKAAEAVFQFLLSDDKEFILSGPAGVGKTYMMQYIMKNVMREYEDSCKLLGKKQTIFSTALTATTNKAAEVLSVSTGFPAVTIHSYLGLKVFDDFKTGQSKISKGRNWTVHQSELIFVDEASMIDKNLYDYIQKGTTSSCKIIYVGDHNQMAPVFEKLSPVYLQKSGFIELTEPVRNAGSPDLMALCKQLRQTVETLEFHPIQEVPGVIDYLDDSQMAHLLDTHFKNEDVDSRILCWSNNQVEAYNEYIRAVRGYPNGFTTGEILINNTGIQTESGKMLRVEQEFTVKSVVSNPYDKSIDRNDLSVVMEVYDMEIFDPVNYSSFRVSIPTNKAHYKALMKYYAKQKDWPVYYGLKNNYPDLRQKDAATVYKAQGSTYESVVLDLGNIGKCTQADQVARMLYVAASRPRQRLYLYGQLPARYRGA